MTRNDRIARREIGRQANVLISEGLAEPVEREHLLAVLAAEGYGATRGRLLRRRETLAAAEPILSDWFALAAAVRGA